MQKSICHAATGLVAGIAAALAAGTQAASPPADLVFMNGAIYTVNPRQPWVEAIAVAVGKIA